MDKLVSIIIPVYNVEQYLRKCLDSIINQTLKNIEIICVNDGSADNSAEILKEYAAKDSRIILINQENKGLGAARNKGMEVADGKYIGFIDSDDWVDENYFKAMYDAAEAYNADMACCGVVRVYRHKTKINIRIAEEKLYTDIYSKLKVTQVPHKCFTVNKLYKKSKIEKHKLRFFEGMFLEDIPFTIRALFFLKSLVTVPEANYYYRVNYRSLTRTPNTDKKQLDILEIRKDFINFIKKNNIKCEEKYYIQSRTVYKLFGITLMAICKWETINKYYLFGFIFIFEKRVSL
jgi:glycosyltransferase involved in cell wall biosynthesis